MRRAIWLALASSFSLCLTTAATHAASVDTKKPQAAQAPVPGVQAPTVTTTQPAVKLGDDTLKAIQDPSLPSAGKIPEQQQVKPKDVPKAVTQPKVDTGKPKVSGGAPKVNVTAPAAPSTAAMRKPELDNTQLQQIRQMQEAAAAAAAIRQIDPDMYNRAGGLPDTTTEDPATGTSFEGRGPGMNQDGPDADALVRDLMLGRGGPASTNPSDYIGPSGNSGPNLNRDPGTAAGALGAPGDPGHAASGPKRTDNWTTGNRVYETHTTDNAQGHFYRREGDEGGLSMSATPDYGETTTTWYMNDGSIKEITETENADGSVTRIVDITDPEGNTTSSIKEIPPPPPEPEQSSTPNENETGNGSNCVGPSNWGCKKGKDNPMDMVTQPVHGDEVANLRGTGGNPNSGPGAVTNPDEHHQGGGGGGGGGEPGEGAVDPEEFIPGGPVPAPGGASASARASDEATDEAMGAATLR